MKTGRIIITIVLMVAYSPRGAFAVTTDPPSIEDIFGDFPVTILEDGSALLEWKASATFRSDSWLFIDPQDGGYGLAFKFFDVEGKMIVDRAGELTIDVTETGGQAVHWFDNYGSRFSINGTVSLRYDPVSGVLEALMEGDEGDMELISVPAYPIEYGSSSCSCTYGSQGSSQSCSTSIECPSGYIAECRCNSAGCRSHCRRVAALLL